MRTLSDYSIIINKYRGRKDLLIEKENKAIKEKNAREKRGKDIEKAQAFLQQVAKDTQEKIKYHIEDIVQLGIDSCFPDEYDFSVDFKISRGKTEAGLYFLKEGFRVSPKDESGGGLVDMGAFGLRLAIWSLGKSRALVVFDEPFRFLSRDLQSKAGEILRRLSEKLKLQVIMVTHNRQMEEISDKVFYVSMEREEEWKKSKIS